MFDSLLAYARNMLVPDSELFQANVRSTYNVIEAASKLGVKKIIIASSETVYGVCFAQGDSEYDCFPLEEDYDCNPADSYALQPPFICIFMVNLLLRYRIATHSPKSVVKKRLVLLHADSTPTSMLFA